MYLLFGADGLEGMILGGGGITGTFSLILIGAILGRMRDLSSQLKKHRDRLDELVKLKTEELRKSNQKLEEEINDRKQAEKNIKETKDNLDNIIESSLDGIVVGDSTGNIIRVNEAFLKLIGYGNEELKGMHIMELSITEKGTYESTTGETVEIDEEFFNNAKIMTYEKLFKEGKITDWETYYLRKDKKIVSVEISVAYLYDEEGTITGSVGINRDISERRTAEKEIKEARDFLDNIFKTTTDGIMITDHQGIITMVNEAVEGMTGYSKNELIGESIDVLKPEGKNYEEQANKYLAKLFEEGTVVAFEFTWLKKDGNLVDVEVEAALLKDSKENITGSVTSIRDITERKQVEKRLREAKEHLDNLIESSLDCIMVSDRTGYITKVNKYFMGLLDYREEEVLGKHVMELTPMNESGIYECITGELVQIGKEYVNKANAMISRLLEEGKATNWESYYFRKDKKVIPIEQNIVCLYDKEGERDGAVAIIRDVTERKKMEQQLLQSEKLKALGELAGGVAHDFNNVLAAILGRAQLLKMIVDSPPSKQERRKSVLELKKGLEVIEKASLDGAETVRRIQEFARRRDDDKYFTLVDMTKVIDNALEFTKLRWKNDAESKGIKIKIKKKLSILPSVSGSEAELREVIVNIINNAIDAMPQGGDITIKTFKEDNHACIKVKDTGTGVPQTMRERIFDPFFTTKGPQSSGLGMSVSYGIIGRHRGSIAVDSVEGKGSTFTIEIPFSEKTEEEEKVKPISSGQKKVKILIVEDEEDVRNLLKDILTHEGHGVETASDGKRGIEKFKKKGFDMVLTDLGMPGMSGWQVAEKIKGINGKVPVVLTTGWNIELEEREIKDKWVDLVIQKPFEVDQVLNIVQEGIILRDRFKEN